MKDPPRPSRKGGTQRCCGSMSCGRSMHHWCCSKQQSCVQCAEARFKNCKAAVQKALRAVQGSFSGKLRKRHSRAQSSKAAFNATGRCSKRAEPGDDIAEDLFRDGLLDIAVFCGCTRLGVLEQVVEARVLFVEAPLRLPPVGGGG